MNKKYIVLICVAVVLICVASVAIVFGLSKSEATPDSTDTNSSFDGYNNTTAANSIYETDEMNTSTESINDSLSSDIEIGEEPSAEQSKTEPISDDEPHFTEDETKEPTDVSTKDHDIQTNGGTTEMKTEKNDNTTEKETSSKTDKATEKETSKGSDKTTVEDNDEPAESGPDTSLTYAEYIKMTAAEQQKYFESFATIDDYFSWYNTAKKQYEDDQNRVDFDGTIDFGDIFGGNN